MTHNNRPTIASHTLSLSYQVYDSTLIYIVVAYFNNGTYNSFSRLSNYKCIYRICFTKRIRLVDKVLILYLMEYDITNIQKNSDPRQDNDIM